MRKLLFIAALGCTLPFASCKKACQTDLTGTLCVQNTTFETVMITTNGTFQGFLNAGTTECYEVNAGLMNLELEPTASFDPPTQVSLTIAACGTTNYEFQ